MPTNPDSDLMRIFDFTAADLEANRAGKLTERQAKRLRHLINNEIRFLSIPVGALLVIAWFIVIKIISVVPPNYDKLPIIIVAMGVLPTFLSIYYLGYKKIRFIRDIQNGDIDALQGTIKIWTVKNDSYLAVLDRRLNLDFNLEYTSRARLQKLPKETIFRVYFVPNSKMVVAMETCAK